MAIVNDVIYISARDQTNGDCPCFFFLVVFTLHHYDCAKKNLLMDCFFSLTHTHTTKKKCEKGREKKIALNLLLVHGG
jgi:hypothetical protein